MAFALDAEENISNPIAISSTYPELNVPVVAVIFQQCFAFALQREGAPIPSVCENASVFATKFGLRIERRGNKDQSGALNPSQLVSPLKP